MSHPENFIPWEQIEPLVRPGMTGADLMRALRERFGLPAGRYKAVSAVKLPVGAPLSEHLRHGITLERDSGIEWTDASDEVIA